MVERPPSPLCICWHLRPLIPALPTTWMRRNHQDPFPLCSHQRCCKGDGGAKSPLAPRGTGREGMGLNCSKRIWELKGPEGEMDMAEIGSF